MTPEIGNRLQGILLGLAAGDRNGGPTQMALRLAESLVELGHFDAEDIFNRYIGWWRQEGFDSGPVADLVFQAVEAGIPRSEAVEFVHHRSGRRTAAGFGPS
jgi:ADP-ribosylglycohydrolase